MKVLVERAVYLLDLAKYNASIPIALTGGLITHQRSVNATTVISADSPTGRRKVEVTSYITTKIALNVVARPVEV